VRRIALAVLLALTAGTAVAQPAADAYGALWRDAAVALVGFARVGTDSAGATDLAARAPGWRRERDRFEAALVQLIKSTPPAELTALHWKLLPLHEELLAALSTVVKAAEAGDRDAVVVGWAWVRQAHATLQRVTAEERSRR
jgi:hypothetical protein